MDNTTTISTDGKWSGILEPGKVAQLEKALPAYLKARRWFGGKARTISSVRVDRTIAVDAASGDKEAFMALLTVNYTEGEPQTYMLPITFAPGKEGAQLEADRPQAVIARLNTGEGEGVLYDASWDPDFAGALLSAIRENKTLGQPGSEVRAMSTDAFAKVSGADTGSVRASILGAEQSNTNIKFGDKFIMKLYRRLEEGTNPDYEIGRFLTNKNFPHIPPLAGALEYTAKSGNQIGMAILQGFITNQGDAWSYTLGQLDEYFDRVAKLDGAPAGTLPEDRHPLDLRDTPIPETMREALGDFLPAAKLLGRRTAEMHLALEDEGGGADFAPEPFTPEYRQEMHSAMHSLSSTAFSQLSSHLAEVPAEAREQADYILSHQAEIRARFQPLVDRDIKARRTRVHGDYHLGQVLYTGNDFVIIDFEGEPVRSIEERRRKYSPLKDVAGMLRSFHYAAYAALFGLGDRAKDIKDVDTWTDAWHVWVGAAYLQEYLQVANGASFLPSDPADLKTLLDSLLLEKAIYELIYELNNRPDWVRIPLQGITQLVK